MSSRSKKKRELQYGSRWAGQEIEERKARIQTSENLVLAKKRELEIEIADLTGSAKGLTEIPEWKKAQLARKQ